MSNIIFREPKKIRLKAAKRWLGCFALGAMLAVGQLGFAQVNSYGFSQSNGVYQSIATDGILVDGTEATTTTTYDTTGWSVELPFSFNFNSEFYTSMFVNSNGGATFGTTTSTGTSLISTSTAYAGAVAVMNRDLWGVFITSGETTSGSNTITNVGSFHGMEIGKQLNGVNGIPTGTTVTAFDEVAGTISMSAPATASAANANVRYGTGKIFTKVEGTAPNRVFTIQWEGYNDYTTTAANSNYFSFQLKLNETVNTIQFVYGEHFNLSTTSRTNQIGLRGATNTDYINRTGVVTNPWDNTEAGTSNSANVARDNVNFPATGLTFTWSPPTCIAPSALTATNHTLNSADLSWASDGTLFDIEWGAGVFAQGAGSSIYGVSSPYTLSGLSSSTAYSFYVRKDCGAVDGQSNWVGPFKFSTLCDVVTALPYVENFDTYGIGATAFPNCWTRPVTYTSGSNEFPSIVALHPTSAPNSLKFQSLLGTPTYAVTPSFAEDIHNLRVRFQLKAESITNSGTMQVGVMSDPYNISTFELVQTIQPTSTSITEYVINFDTTTLSGGNKYIAFRHNTNSTSWYYWLDDVEVELLPSCVEPSELTATDLTLTTAVVSWTSSGSLFDIQWGEEGFMLGTGNIVNGVTAPYTLTLNTDTTYSYYVRQDCGVANGQSTWAGPYTFHLGHCVPAGTSTTNYITGFTTSGGTVNISNTDNGLSASGYGDFFIFHNVTQEVGNEVSFEATTMGTQTSGFKIWVDWNQNGSFEDAGELMYSTTAYANIHTGSFIVPNDALAGQTRMRIGNSNTPNTGPATPCMTNLSGEFEDYMFTVVVPTCAKPFALTLDAVTINSATISWTSDGTLFDVEFGEEGFFQSGVPTVSGTTNPYTKTGLDPLTSYEIYVRQDCGTDGYSNWAGPFKFTTECLPPSITGTTPGAVCGEGEVTLSATADGGNINWYAAETGGTKLFTGANFTTPLLTTTTSYWVEAFDGANGFGGLASPIGTSATTASNYGLIFTATEDFTLNTVDLYLAGAAGNLVVNLTDNNGVVLDTRTIALPAGGTASSPIQHTVTLDFAIEPGSYRLIAVSGPSMIRDSSGTNYPYAVGDVASITNGYISGTSTSYYYFYNWSFTAGCGSDRTEVVATVTAAPDFALSQTTLEICEADTSDAVTITTGSADYDTYEWMPNTGVSGDATIGWSFDPTETTTYVLTASQSTGAACMTTLEVQVNVNPLPVAITVVASETEVCDDTIVALSITGNINNGVAILGDGTTSPASYPNPFNTLYGGSKHQMLYTAAELSAQGMIAGSEISAVTFDIEAVNATNGVCVDFTIRMGATTVEVMTGLVSGTTTVYGPTTFTPSTVGIGLVSFTLTTPYVWDGISNLIVETVHNAGNSGNGSGTKTKATTTTNNTVFRGVKDSVAGGIAGLDATTFTVTGAHNQRPNMTFTYSLEQTDITWSPATNLYTDAAATTAYVADDFATAVYFKADAAGTVTYTATSHTDEGCSISDSADITVNQTPDAPVATSPQSIVDGQTIADIVVTGNNLTWYTDEDLIDEVDDSTVLTEGSYTFYVTASIGDCTSEATMIVVEVSLSTKDFDAATFKAYPNPVKDYFTISYSKDIQNIAVINMLGQTVFTKTVHATDTQIDMTALPTGSYFVKVNVDGAVKTIKVVKQ
ncbi:MAG TPA: GEVED domain-containing protein [Flavobacterium sp.]|nr:GEVED domain-containing protein [Flavobacterium sp.]